MKYKIFMATAMMAATGSIAPAEAHFTAGCKKNACKRHVLAPFKKHVLSIVSCESSRRWFINRRYDGGLQFDPTTWSATGSNYTFAYQAPPLEQMYRGVVWASMIGWRWKSTAGWPVCG